MTDAPKPLILIVDDEPQIRRLLTVTLEANGYNVLPAVTGQEGLVLAAQHRPSLIILDIGLPDLSGKDVLSRLREWSNVPVVILSVQSDEKGKVAALDAGADDYVTKPFALHEFLARVKARLRRQTSIHSGHEEAIALGSIVLDPSRQQLTVRGKEVALAPKEFGLLRVLMENQGRVVTRQTLLDKVWGYDFEGEQQTVSVHIRWLREKIEEDSRTPRHILTVRSRGYMFKA